MCRGKRLLFKAFNIALVENLTIVRRQFRSHPLRTFCERIDRRKLFGFSHQFIGLPDDALGEPLLIDGQSRDEPTGNSTFCDYLLIGDRDKNF
jgi:hypothetical protein